MNTSADYVSVASKRHASVHRMPLVKEDFDLDSGSGWFTFAAADEVGWTAKLRDMAAKMCFHGDNAEEERTALHHVSHDLGDLA